MNNKQWEEELEQLKPTIKNYDGKFERVRDIVEALFDELWLKQKPAIKQFIHQREAEIRKEAIEDHLKSEEGKVYQDYQTMKKQAENDVRKETIKAVLPEEKELPDYNAIKYDKNNAWNEARQSIIDKAKEKFNITI